MELFTIGYEGLKLDNFIKYLKFHDISTVADVRHLPASRKKGFSKNGLREFLGDNSIKYISVRELGTSKGMREDLKKTGDYETFFSLYRQVITKKKEHLEGIHAMVQEGERVALMCFEKEAARCHRKIIADAIKVIDGNGLKIKHIATF
jgi:uncharacterized protein (DUF488 family)